MKWVTTSWTHSIIRNICTIFWRRKIPQKWPCILILILYALMLYLRLNLYVGRLVLLYCCTPGLLRNCPWLFMHKFWTTMSVSPSASSHYSCTLKYQSLYRKSYEQKTFLLFFGESYMRKCLSSNVVLTC